MADEFLVADLTMFSPSWRAQSGREGTFFPSFCLPWFGGELPLVGAAARLHRRGTALEAIEPETRLDMANRSRRHWAEGWIALNEHPDSVAKANERMRWHPPGEPDPCEFSFSLAVCLALQEVRKEEKELGLVVPGGLGPGPRQQLLDALKREFPKVQFFPRSVAVALDWCRCSQGIELLRSTQATPGNRVGSVIIASCSTDRWEAALVPLRLEEEGGKRYLCPVQDRTQFPSEANILGFPWQMSKADTVESGLLDLLLDNTQPKAERGHRERYDAALDLLPEGWRQPDSLPCFHSIEERLGIVVGAASQLPAEEGLVAVLIAGPWSQKAQVHNGVMGATQDLDVPVLLMGHESPLQGAAEGMGRIHQGLTPYYEALVPLRLHYNGVNRFNDPVNKWQDLLENTEVPAGRMYRSPEPIKGFSLDPGTALKIKLFLEAKRRGERQLGVLEVQAGSELTKKVDVEIEARVQPGQGLAMVEVNSGAPENFHVEMQEDKVKPIEKLPPLVYGWPPGSAYVVSHEYCYGGALRNLQNLASMIQDRYASSEDFAHVRNQINTWIPLSRYGIDPTTLDLPHNEIADEFVYLGVFPSERRPVDPSLEWVLEMLDQHLHIYLECDCDPAEKRGGLFFASWLYARCPRRVLDIVRSNFDNDEKVSNAALAVAGNCFTEIADFQRFFRSFVLSIMEEKPAPQNWIRAYRNLVRFRPLALGMNALSPQYQDVIFQWYLEAFNDAITNASPGIMGHCAFLAPHLLKRRRFDPGFLRPRSAKSSRFSATLDRALRQVETESHKENIRCAKDFLERRADHTTLRRLGRATEA